MSDAMDVAARPRREISDAVALENGLNALTAIVARP
jgi:hypothetical protein